MERRFLVPLRILGGLLLCLLLAGSERDVEQPTHIFLIVHDTLRADHLGCYGYGRPVSPRLDALAERGTIFDAAQALSSWTRPSSATILTSLTPDTHGLGYFDSVLPEGTQTLASTLRKAGWDTHALSASIHIGKAGLDQGFRRFETVRRVDVAESTTPQILAAVQSTLDPRRKQFFYLHLIGPHGPYTPSPAARKAVVGRALPRVDARQLKRGHWYEFESEEERRYLEALYDGEIRDEDGHFGRFLGLLEERDLLSSSLLVITSDHGEAFGEHGVMEHGNNLFSEETHVPLIFFGPGVPVVRRTEVVGLHDVAPSILDLVGVSAPGGFQGLSLFAPLPDDRAIPLREFRESPRDKEMRGLLYRGYKAVWSDGEARGQLYRGWGSDAPGDDVADVACGTLEEMRELHRLLQVPRLERRSQEIDAETMDALRELGYVE